MSSTSQSPNWREILSARSTITGKQEYLTSTNGILNINGSFSVTGGATSANQTNGQQLVQIVDAGGEAVTVTGGKLDVNATASLAGSSIPISGATTAVGVAIVDSSGNQISSFGGGTQYTDGGIPPTHPIGGTIEWSDGSNWQTVSTAKPLPVTIGNISVAVTGTVTSNAGTNLNTSLLALESGGNLSSIKTDADNLNLAQGSTTSGQKGNLTLGAVTTSAPTYTTAQSNPLSLTTSGLLRVDGSGVTQPVSLTSTTITGTVAATQSGTWTNTVTQSTAANLNATVVGTGTFVVQATLAAETTKVIGTVNQGTSPWVVNQSQIGGNNISAGVGASGTGTQRIIPANDMGKTIVSVSGSASSSGNNTIVAAGTNRLKVFAFTLSTTSTTAITAKFQSGASGTDIWSVILQAPTSVSTGANLVVSPPAWLFATATATLLNLNLSSANAVQWSISYFDEA